LIPRLRRKMGTVSALAGLLSNANHCSNLSTGTSRE
jgi:hypothetical protein